MQYQNDISKVVSYVVCIEENKRYSLKIEHTHLLAFSWSLDKMINNFSMVKLKFPSAIGKLSLAWELVLTWVMSPQDVMFMLHIY